MKGNFQRCRSSSSVSHTKKNNPHKFEQKKWKKNEINYFVAFHIIDLSLFHSTTAADFPSPYSSSSWIAQKSFFKSTQKKGKPGMKKENSKQEKEKNKTWKKEYTKI